MQNTLYIFHIKSFCIFIYHIYIYKIILDCVTFPAVSYIYIVSFIYINILNRIISVNLTRLQQQQQQQVNKIKYRKKKNLVSWWLLRLNWIITCRRLQEKIFMYIVYICSFLFKYICYIIICTFFLIYIQHIYKMYININILIM